MSYPTNNSRAWQQTPSDWWPDLFPLPVPMRVFVKDKISLLLVIKAHKCTLKSRTGPQQLLNLICIISIVFCKLYTVYSGILQEIRTLPGDWGNGSIWVLQTHSQGPVLVPSFTSPVIPVFMKQLVSQYLFLRSEHANKESAFTSVDSSWSWVCQWEWRGGGTLLLRLGAAESGKNASLVPGFILVLVHCKNNLRVCGIMEDIQMFKMEFLDCYWDLNPSKMISISLCSTRLFIRDCYQWFWGESWVFGASQQIEIIWYQLTGCAELQIPSFITVWMISWSP